MGIFVIAMYEASMVCPYLSTCLMCVVLLRQIGRHDCGSLRDMIHHVFVGIFRQQRAYHTQHLLAKAASTFISIDLDEWPFAVLKEELNLMIVLSIKK